MNRRFDQGASPTTQSPCVRNCCLDENDVCLGCGRSLQEILDWRGASPEEQQAILIRAHERRMQRRREFRKIV